MRWIARFLAFTGAFLAGCASSSAPVKPAPAILAHWSGFYGGPETPATRVIAHAAEWSALWEQLGREPPRSFDPVHERAVVVFLGQRRTGGYRVDIESVREERGSLVIAYREETPPRGSMVPQVLTAPWTVAVLAASRQPIVFSQLPSNAGSAPPPASAR